MAGPDSLILCERFELMGGGVQSDIPELIDANGIGAVFSLLAPTGTSSAAGFSPIWSLGEPQPTVSLVQTLMLDGERPFGSRASNRTVTLQIKITSSTPAIVAAARELLMQALDAQTFTMMYTPSSTGLTTVFDCFRALPATVGYGFQPGQPTPISVMTVTFQALPYGRDDPSNLQQVAFASPLYQGVSAPPAPVTLDNCSSATGNANWSVDTKQFITGTSAVKYTPPSSSNVPVSFTKSGLSLNITGLTAMSAWLGQAFDTAHWASYPAFISNVTVKWVLTDNASHTLSFSKTINKVPWASNPANPKWTRLTAPIPKSSVFNFTAVTAYKITLTNFTSRVSGSGFVRMYAWLDAITANPPSLANPASQRGVVYNLMGTGGTARTPVSTQFQLPQAGPTSLELTGSGLWWPPVGVTSVKAECIGAGGAGGARSTSGFGGGGGGGAYAAEPSLTVAAGTPVPYSCGVGGLPGQASASVTFAQPGTGNWVCPANVTTVQAECWGGGASGGYGGGGGGGGEYAKETSVAVTAGKTYQFTVGAGGDPNNRFKAGAGGTTTFTGNSVTVTANGGGVPHTGSTQGGTGGTGSTNATHHNGGAGGTSPGYGGGGGGSAGNASSAGVAGGSASGTTGGAGATGFSAPFDGSIAGWSAVANCSIAASSAQFHSGTGSMSMTSAAAGNMTATYGSGVTGAWPAAPGQTCTLSGWFRTAVSARSCQMEINWYDSSGNYISTSSTPTITDSSSAWTNASGTVTAPALARWANVIPMVSSAGGASEVHYVDDITFAGGTSGGAGASQPGFPAAGLQPGGGAGGGYTDPVLGTNSAGAAGGTGQVTLTYTIGAGSPVNGTATTFGSAATTTTVVTANGGASVALNTATGGAGGTIGSNTVKFAGGAGSTVTSVGGGGGGSGGSASAGTSVASNTATGAAGVAGGGKGANGTTVANTSGDNAPLFGGGGGGSDSTGTAVLGGQGGAGGILLTWTPPIAPFSTLIAHRPGAQSPPELNPCVPINNTADAPSGLQYTVPSLTPGVNALFNGTYSVVLVAYNWDSPATSRQITVTVTQFEYFSGFQDQTYPLSVTRTITPSTDITNGIVLMGELTLPVKPIDPSNTSAYFTVSITDTNNDDQFLDVLFLDTQGSTVIVNIPAGNSYVNMFIDEPTPDRDLGLILGSDLDRSQAISVMDSAVISGSPFYITPGDNLFLSYTTAGAPNLGASYLNRWYLERIV